MWRALPPARSPLTLPAILGGAVAGTIPRRAQQARRAAISELTRRFGAESILLADSGTSALALAIRHAIPATDRSVAVPAYGCFDLATATIGAGAKFVLYDVDPGTLAPSMPSLQRALEAGADRIVVVHHYGLPVDLGPVETLAAQFGATIIDDAAQGIGASMRGRPVGSSGSFGVLSFGRGKGLTAGRGGALLANTRAAATVLDAASRELGPASSAVREFPLLVAQWTLGRPSLYAIPESLPFLGLGETVFHAPSLPTRPSNLSLGVLERSLATVDPESDRRRLGAAILRDALAGTGITAPRVAEHGVAGYLRFPVLLPPGAVAAVATPTARALGIRRGYPVALCDLTGFGDRRKQTDDKFEGARLLAARLATLPVHGAVSTRDLARLVAWIKQIHS